MRNDFTFQPTITKEEINELPIEKFEGEIIYIDNIDNLNKVLPELKEERVLGFDTETRPAFKKGVSYDVSLLQLSSKTKAFVIRLNKVGFPDSLKEILADPDVVKVGVAIHDDIIGLQKINHFEPESFIELQTYVKDYGIEDNGLKKLTANILGFKISKRQQTSNWETEVLTQAQIEYAATDAWVCYQIYNVLMQ